MFTLDKNLYFFDNGIRYQYFLKRSRKPTELLPATLKEVRSTGSVVGATKLDTFLHKQKRIPVLSETDGKVKSNDTKLIDLNAAVKVTVTDGIEDKPATSKKKDILKASYASEDEDDSRFLFEESKFSATTIILQLGKLLDHLLNDKIEFGTGRNSKLSVDQLKRKVGTPNILWDYKYHTVTLPFTLPNQLVDLLNLRYEDLIKHAEYKIREWQTQTYRDIIGSTVKNTDSGIFSVPQTAMSGLYLKPETADEKARKKKKVKVDPSKSVLNALQVKLSKDSGMTSDSDGPSMIAYRRESKTPIHTVQKPKTRFEKFYQTEKGKIYFLIIFIAFGLNP